MAVLRHRLRHGYGDPRALARAPGGMNGPIHGRLIMKASLKLMVYFGLTISFLSFGGIVTLTRADDDFDKVSGERHKGNKVKWEQIVGSMTMGLPNMVGGFEWSFFPWTAERRGRAVVDLSSGKMKF